MILTRASKRYISLFLAIFFLCGIIHPFAVHLDFVYCFSSLVFGVLTIIWAITVQRRVVDDRLRLILMLCAACLLFHFFLQILRYDLISNDRITVRRYLWYAMYIPMISQPTLCLFLAVNIYRPKDKPLPIACYLTALFGILLILGVLTNDLHFWVKSFPYGIMIDDKDAKNGWMFYVVNGYIYGLFAFDYCLFVSKSRKCAGRLARLIPLIPFAIGVIYFVLYPFEIGIRLFGTRLWHMGDMFAFCLIATLEFCIQAGMIPANMGYENIYEKAYVPSVILDHRGSVVYKTANASYPFPQDQDIKIQSHPISGGSVEWTLDMGPVRKLNRQLEDATQQMENRNAYLMEENRIKKERQEVETRSRLYENISRIVKPQFEQIADLLKDRDHCDEKQLARVCVLNAYIKRRSNMELLAEGGELPSSELTSAIRESLEYVRLCGAETAMAGIGESDYPSEIIIDAYERIEDFIEKNLHFLSDIAIIVRCDDGQGADRRLAVQSDDGQGTGRRLTVQSVEGRGRSGMRQLSVRMMLKADDFVYEQDGHSWECAGFSGKVTFANDKQDLLIVLLYREGGEET